QADSSRQSTEDRQPNHGAPDLSWVLMSFQRVIRAHGYRERGSHEARLPAAVPGADHHGDRENGQAALGNIGKKQGRNQGERRAEHSDAVTQNWVLRRGNEARAKKGEV